MENNKLILSNYEVGETVYYIMDCRIIEKHIIGVKAEVVKEFDVIEETLEYKIDITLGNGWVSPSKLFSSKIEAGGFLLEMNGLDVTLKEK